MTSIHIYTTDKQRATRYKDPYVNRWFKQPKKRRLFAVCCHKFRNAENLVIQCYYDTFHYSCAEGKGCKHGSRRKKNNR